MFACHLILCVGVVKTMMTFFANWRVRFDPKLCTYSAENMHGGLFDGGLLGRLKCERRSLEVALDSVGNRTSLATSCCTYGHEVLFSESTFDSWKATLPLFDKKIILFDLMLLQNVPKAL